MWMIMPLHDEDDFLVGDILINRDVKDLEILANNCDIDLLQYC